MMKTKEIQAQVKNGAMEVIGINHNDANGTVQFGNYDYAIPVIVEGVTYYAKVSVSCGRWKDTKTTAAFDPEVARAVWLTDLAEKAMAADAKAAAKRAAKAAKAAASK